MARLNIGWQLEVVATGGLIGTSELFIRGRSRPCRYQHLGLQHFVIPHRNLPETTLRNTFGCNSGCDLLERRRGAVRWLSVCCGWKANIAARRGARYGLDPMTSAEAYLERPPTDPHRRASVIIFVLLTFTATWTLWIGASAFVPDSLAFASLPGTIMPAVVALWLTRRESERSFRDLVARLFKWRVSVWYYVFALTFMAAAKLAAASLYRLDTGEWPAFGTTPLVVMLIGILLSTPVQAGEEIGWRGFLLQRLSERMGFAWASLLVGLIWAAWHLPMFFMRGGDMVGLSFPVFVLMVTALSVALAWLYSRTGGSLLLPMIMHAAINNMTAIVPSRSPADPDHVFLFFTSPIGWLTTIILWAVAAILFMRMRGSRH